MSKKTTADPNHSAHIVELTNVRPHSNADRLKLATVLGSTIVVGIEAKDGDTGLYFQSGLQLNVDYAKANDLIRRKDPKTGKPAGGMFDDNCRVRTQTFRKEKSDGFFIGLESLVNYGIEDGIVQNLYNSGLGEYFETIDGKPLCNKYVPKNTKIPGTPNTQKAAKKASYPMFKEHFDTTQVRFVIDQFKPNDTITITEKLHGTSQRSTNTLVTVKHRGWKRFINYLTMRPNEYQEWKTVHGTRRVILDDMEKSGFHAPSLRQLSSAKFEGTLRKGETVYYEVVGYEGTERPIMGRYENKKVSKEFAKEYGKETVFSYGTEPGECDVYVYRITITTPDGYSVDLPWQEVIDRCGELGVKPVPTLAGPGSIGMFATAGEIMLGKGDQPTEDSLTEIFEHYAKGPSTIDQRHLKEGICIRMEVRAQATVYKHKSFEYKVLEGILNPDTAGSDVEEEV